MNHASPERALVETDDRADAALTSMRQRGIPPNPVNYEIWYNDVAGTNPELSRVLRSLERSGETFDERRSADLHERFFGIGREAEVVDRTGRQIETMLADLAGHVGEASEGASRYEGLLNGLGNSLATCGSYDSLRKVLRSVLSETGRMREHARRLETELSKRSDEMATLIEDLVEARKEARTDPLTGLANRKAFDLELGRAASSASEKADSLGLLMIDIDHFKKFNDTHGHSLGDKVLQLVARTLQECAVDNAVPARYGGEEFAIIVPHVSLDEAVALAENVRLSVAGSRVVIRNSGLELGRITLSAGVARYRQGETVAAFVDRADAALYEAKDRGRNQVVAASDDCAAAALEAVAAG